jgi:hypothetical protein
LTDDPASADVEGKPVFFTSNHPERPDNLPGGSEFLQSATIFPAPGEKAIF